MVARILLRKREFDMKHPYIGALTATALGLSASVTQAQPAFHAPFPCGQVWQAGTYAGHGPFQIDIVQLDGAGRIIGENQPTLASAAGTISLDYTWPDGDKEGERWVFVDHDNGWRTHYVHLADEPGQPRFALGRRISRGEILGFTSNSGASTVHLHYAQMDNTNRDAAWLDGRARANRENWGRVLRDGDKQWVAFNGRQIETRLSNLDSHNFGDPESEKILSANCRGGRFASWEKDGETYILRYSPGGRNVRINRIHPTGDSNPQTFDGGWSERHSTVVPFESRLNRQPYVFVYSFASGQARFMRIGTDFDSITFLKLVPKYAGWTEIVPMRIANRPFSIFYDSRYGWFNVDEINATSDGFISRLKTRISKGITHLVPIARDSDRFVLTYRAATGVMQLHRLVRQNNGSITHREVWSDTRKAGWTHMTLLEHRGDLHVLGYDQDSGDTRLWPLLTGENGLGPAKRLSLDAGWTQLTPYQKDGRAHVLAYRLTGGGTVKMRLRDDLNSFRYFTRDTWTTGYR